MTHSDSVAVVTGSARNIGRATAIKLGELGFSVVVHTNNDDENLQQTADLVRQTGVECATAIGSLDNPDTVIALNRACNTLGHCRVLVNNASVRKTKPFLEMTLEEWRQVTVETDRALDGDENARHGLRSNPRGEKARFVDRGQPSRRR